MGGTSVMEENRVYVVMCNKHSHDYVRGTQTNVHGVFSTKELAKQNTPKDYTNEWFNVEFNVHTFIVDYREVK
jgi:hypothetical protein